MISIIIPLFNRESLIGETLNSIVAQTYTDWECIIVDDGSTDNSIEVVQKYVEQDSRFCLLSRPKDRIKGAPTCRNYGLEKAMGEYVYFFDSDDLISQNFFETIINEMKKNPDAEYAVFPLDRFITSYNHPVSVSRKYQSCKDDILSQIISLKIQVNTPAIFWQHNLLKRSGIKWREGKVRMQEGDFIGRNIVNANKGIWIETNPLVHYRLHDNSISGMYTGSNQEAELMFESRKVIYDYIEEIKAWTPSLKQNFLKSLLRLQIISAVIHGNHKIAGEYYFLISKMYEKSIKSNCILLLSKIIFLSTPIIYVVTRIFLRKKHTKTK